MNGDLFACDSSLAPAIHFDMPDAKVSLYQSLYSIIEADLLFNELKRDIQWGQEVIEMYGQKHNVPRLTAWYGDTDKIYTYSGITSHSLPWTKCLLNIKQCLLIHL